MDKEKVLWTRRAKVIWSLVFLAVVALIGVCKYKDAQHAAWFDALSYEQKLETLLTRHEGYRDHVYRCTSGCRTIGIGHNLEGKLSETEIARLEQTGATREQIETWFQSDVAQAQRAIEELYGSCGWYQNLSENRRVVLVDMCFNLGPKGLPKFKRMIAALERCDYDAASDEMMDSLWAQQTKNRAVRLADIMEHDRYRLFWWL